MNVVDFEEAGHLIKAGYIGVVPTDTVYGIVGSAFNKKAVERIFEVKQRDQNKRCIVLAANTDTLAPFGISQNDLELAKKYWPNSISIELQVGLAPDYLSRGFDKISFRIPKSENIQNLLQTTGPIIAPSANIQDGPIATDINAAQEIFGESIDFYVDGGFISGKSSTLITFEDSTPKVLRQGDIQI